MGVGDLLLVSRRSDRIGTREDAATKGAVHDSARGPSRCGREASGLGSVLAGLRSRLEVAWRTFGSACGQAGPR